MEKSELLSKLEFVSKVSSVMAGEKIWKLRSSDTEIVDGSMVISHETYREQEWKMYGTRSGRPDWVEVKKHRYYVGIISDGVVYSTKSTEEKLVTFKYEHTWVPVEVSEEKYLKAKVAKEKADKKAEEARIAREEAARKAEEERIERERKEKEEEELRRIEAERAEEERLAQPMMITVGMWEDLMSQISDLQERLDHAERYIDFGEPGAWC